LQRSLPIVTDVAAQRLAATNLAELLAPDSEPLRTQTARAELQHSVEGQRSRSPGSAKEL